MISDNKSAGIGKEQKEVPLSAPISISTVFSAWDHLWNENYSFSGESHKYHEVVYVVSGEVTVTEDDRIFRLQKGNLIVHAPYEFHRISTENGARVLVFTFDTDFHFPYELYSGYFTLNETERRIIEEIFKTVHTFYRQATEGGAGVDTYLQQEIASAVPAFLLSLVRTHTSNLSSHVMSKSEEEYKCIVDTMKRTVNDNLSLEDIAALNHVSVSYVKKLFQRYAGIGAKEYYSTLRYNEVIRLCESGAPIAEIAERLNFSSPEYLSLFFKKRMGVPPGRWRNTKK